MPLRVLCYKLAFQGEQTMRTINLAQYMADMLIDLNKFSVGLEPSFKTLDYVRQSSTTGFPPYDLEQTSDNQYRLTMAVAGYASEDIDITQQGEVLTIEGRAQHGGGTYLHKGIAQRAFRRSFVINSWVRVSGTSLQNGILTVDFIQEVPEEHKPRRIPVGFTETAAIAQN
ncbi:IbpA Molecular chaperone (small heat shock protein) [uncultured Caudovirales phage]|uniref:IbpA Molecular chaperone (Small heat shock protein) n=1 Tax=uncultured Caudovirales phage TaxID=2100421 RepID=A0A6J5KP49_9CAUD|nr:IbpA Molecular chaperone (small heat shock protein) [uncultured Caudovirales phage]